MTWTARKHRHLGNRVGNGEYRMHSVGRIQGAVSSTSEPRIVSGRYLWGEIMAGPGVPTSARGKQVPQWCISIS